MPHKELLGGKNHITNGGLAISNLFQMVKCNSGKTFEKNGNGDSNYAVG